MTIDDIKGTVCKYFNSREDFSIPFVKSPANTPAPVGNYIAVKAEGVEQHGSEMKPAPDDGAVFLFEQVATLALTEVEGDGDNLRNVKNLMQRRDFLDFAAEAGFTVWNFTDIMAVDTFDGEFYVRQWRFTIRVNFEDVITEDVPNIESVEPLTLTGE